MDWVQNHCFDHFVPKNKWPPMDFLALGVIQALTNRRPLPSMVAFIVIIKEVFSSIDKVILIRIDDGLGELEAVHGAVAGDSFIE